MTLLAFACCPVFIGLFSFDVSAQQRSIRVYSISEGLPQSQVMGIAQDRKGFLWFGTFGGGVARFDGMDFENYNIRNGLANNHVHDIIEAADGCMWFATLEGVSCFNGHQFDSYTTEHGLPANAVSVLSEDDLGNM